MALACAPVHAIDRDQLEAAIVYNFLLYVEWPDESTWESHALTVCLDPASPLLPEVRKLVGRPVRGLRLAVQALDADPRRCQTIVVDSAVAAKAASLVHGNTSKSPVLLVEASGFARCDVATIQLVEDEGRIAFDISQKRAREVGLTVSSRLLRLARKVSD